MRAAARRGSPSRTTASAWTPAHAGQGIRPVLAGGPFVRPREGGLGLGLALVKSLVDRHDGTVSAHSEGKGRGSEFVVSLPLLAARAARPQARQREGTAPAGRPGLRLLIVDDNRDAAEMLGMLLGAAAMRSTSRSPATMRLRASRNSPDACLLDVGLPDMNGYELARRLRELPETRDAAMIAITGYGSADDREQSARAGIQHHLTKPVDTEKLAKLLAQIALGQAQAIT